MNELLKNNDINITYFELLKNNPFTYDNTNQEFKSSQNIFGLSLCFIKRYIVFEFRC